MKSLKHIPGVLAFLVLNAFSLNPQASTVISLFTGDAFHCANNPDDPAANCWTASKSSGNERHYKIPNTGASTILSAFGEGVHEVNTQKNIRVSDFRAAVPVFAGLTELYKADSKESPLQSAPDTESGILKDSYATSPENS